MLCKYPIWLGDVQEEVACGRCIPCMVNSRRDWAVRLYEEWAVSDNAYFITMTYDEDNVPHSEWTGERTLKKEDVQSFLRAIKDKCRVWDPVRRRRSYRTPRWFVVGEYGPRTFRPHYHALVFNLPDKVRVSLRSIWKKGNIRVAKLTAKRVMYAAKYQITLSMGEHVERHVEAPFKIVTKSSGGIGSAFIKKEENRGYLAGRGDGQMHSRRMGVVPLPRYYMRKLGLCEEQRVAIQLHREAVMERKFSETIESLRSLGYVDPYAELREREEEYLMRVKKKIYKIAVL